MNMKKKKILFLVLLTTLLMAFPPVLLCSAQMNNIDIVIVVDTYHNPVLLNFSKAFNYLNDTFNNRTRVYYINNTLNSSTLSGVSIYVVPPSNRTFSDKEKNIIKSYLKRGGIVIIMGMEYVKGRDFNPDIIIMDDLLSSMPLDMKVNFNYTKGLGNVLIDPLFQDYYLHITEDLYTEPMRDFLGDKTYNLVLMSTVITIESPNISSLKIIKPPTWSYAVCGDGTTILYFESGTSIFFVEKVGDGLLIALGFATSLSDLIVQEYNMSWIDMAENREFWVSIVKSALNIQHERSLFQYSMFIWLIPLTTGIILIACGLLSSIVIRKRKKRVKKRVEPRISEIIKKMREKKK